jgi:phospholipase C
MRGYDGFYAMTANGSLPSFSWVLPRQGLNLNKTTGKGENGDHPCHDIALGERLLKDTYEAPRAGPGWNTAVFIATYDDTGGFYSHSAVPVGVPAAPDDEPACGHQPDFSWLGVRSPTLLIHPWAPKGKVIHEPSGSRHGDGARTVRLSTSARPSPARLIKHIFNLPNYLTHRGAWAGSFALAHRGCPSTQTRQCTCPRRLLPLILEVAVMPTAMNLRDISPW